MEEVKNVGIPAESKLKKRHKISVVDAVVFVIILVFIIILTKTLLNQLNLKHEVSAAKIVTNSVIADLKKQDASAARSLGDKTFQTSYSTEFLANKFKAAEPYITSSPLIIDQTVSNGKTASGVGVTYQYGSKKPFYVQVIVRKANGSDKWQLFAINGNTDKSALIKK